MAYVSRVSIDIDRYGPWKLRAIRAYYNLRATPGIYEVDFRISSGRGLHLIGKSQRRLSEETIDQLRHEHGDDLNRIRMDEIRGESGSEAIPSHPTQTCWTDKGSRDNSADDDFGDIFDALELIEQATKTDYERIHDVANDGRRAAVEFAGIDRTEHVRET